MCADFSSRGRWEIKRGAFRCGQKAIGNPHLSNFFSLRKRGDQRSFSRVGSSRFFESATKRKDVSPLYLIPEFPRSNILHKGVRILAAVDQARIFGHSPSEFYVNTSCKGIGRPKLLERVDLLRLQLLSSTRPASWTEVCIIKRIDISSLDLPFEVSYDCNSRKQLREIYNSYDSPRSPLQLDRPDTERRKEKSESKSSSIVNKQLFNLSKREIY